MEHSLGLVPTHLSRVAPWMFWRTGIGCSRVGSGLESLSVWGHTWWELGVNAPGNGAASWSCILDFMWMVF